MKTSHWGIIGVFVTPLANQLLTSICGHSIDVTTIDVLSIFSAVFSATLGSVDWLHRHVVTPYSNPSPSSSTTPVLSTPVSNAVVVPVTSSTSNGFTYNVNWNGTDSTSGLPTLLEGQLLQVTVASAQIITIEVKQNNNLVLVDQADGQTVSLMIKRLYQSLKGRATLTIHAYSPSLGWGGFDKDFMIV